jgi:protein TonB
MHLMKYSSVGLLVFFAFMFVQIFSGFTKYCSNDNQHLNEYNKIKDTLPNNDDLKIFDKVEVEASFAGGDMAWREFLQNNLKSNVPVKHKAPVGAYTVVIQFVVDKEGNISDIKALTNHGYGMEKEVMRIIKKSPKWTPAYQNNRPVKAYRKQPVTFVISKE